ncbi:hypothetical protein F0562_028595 [Nyssa sinensis]|uniref:BURP domain-containing protein n=1 Tax=Nyssa sinensis TaxID=561372 RepID=A0A5J5B2X0_9ASTE|nr:hypothetical protein F0562_028595 [Nyssa sinensis]
MGSVFASCCLLLYVLLVLKSAPSSRAREISRGHWNDVKKEVYDLQHHVMDGQKGMYVDDGHHQKILRKHVHDHPSSHMDHMDPALNVFFTVSDLKVGKKMPIYFPIKDPSSSPHLLSREEADSIPFSLSQLPSLLEFFSFSQDSLQAKAMEETLRHCEFKPIKGETKFCSNSLESMLDSTHGILGLDTQFKVLTTTHLSKPTALLQNYTILEVPKEISAPKMVACHTMPYPYAVFYCHCQESDNKLYEVSLGSENGDTVEAVGVCHMDTSQWDPDHVSFHVLRIQPGSSPVCHFFPADNLIWVPSSALR